MRVAPAPQVSGRGRTHLARYDSVAVADQACTTETLRDRSVRAHERTVTPLLHAVGVGAQTRVRSLVRFTVTTGRQLSATSAFDANQAEPTAQRVARCRIGVAALVDVRAGHTGHRRGAGRR